MSQCGLASGAHDALFVWLFALVFAMIEIEVEGKDGWAKNLPTPKNVLAHLSLYHIYMILLAVVVVSGFVYFRYQKPCTAINPNRTNQSAPHPLLMGPFVSYCHVFFGTRLFMVCPQSTIYGVGLHAL